MPVHSKPHPLMEAGYKVSLSLNHCFLKIHSEDDLYPVFGTFVLIALSAQYVLDSSVVRLDFSHGIRVSTIFTFEL